MIAPRFAAILSLAALCLAGCAPLSHVEAPRPAAILGQRPDADRIPIREFVLDSKDRKEELESDMHFFSGISRQLVYHGQARAYLAQDLRDYVASRFRIDPSADAVLKLNLVQAQSYISWRATAVSYVPYVGLALGLIGEFQKQPITFIAELKADAAANSFQLPAINMFVRRTDAVTNWKATEGKHQEIYRDEINQVRKELFDRLDKQLLVYWQSGSLSTKPANVAANNEATLASELARAETDLADEKITQEAYGKLVTALKAKYPLPASAQNPATPPAS